MSLHQALRRAYSSLLESSKGASLDYRRIATQKFIRTFSASQPDPVDSNNPSQDITPYPPLAKTPPHKLPTKARIYPIPFRISPQPEARVYATSTAKTNANPAKTAQCDNGIIGHESYEEIFRQIYLSPTPYHDAFEEHLDLRRWYPTDHPTAGLRIIQEGNRAFLFMPWRNPPRRQESLGGGQG